MSEFDNLEERVDDLEDDEEGYSMTTAIVYEDPEPGVYRTHDGDVVTLEEADPIMILPEEAREEAEL